MNKMNSAATQALTPTRSFSLTNSRPVLALAHLYSLLLEENIPPTRALRLLHAQLACLIAVLPATMSLWLHLLLLAWAGVAVWQCRKK